MQDTKKSAKAQRVEGRSQPSGGSAPEKVVEEMNERIKRMREKRNVVFARLAQEIHFIEVQERHQPREETESVPCAPLAAARTSG